MTDKKKRVLLMSPNIFAAYSGSLVRYKVNAAPTLAIAMLASISEKEGYNVKAVDLSVSSESEFLSCLSEFKPHIVGMTFTINQYQTIKSLIHVVRKHSHAKIILGGPHVSGFSIRSFKELKPDIIVVGEGETAFREILQHKNLKNVEGIVFSDKHNIISTAAAHSEKLEFSPFPDWSVFDMSKYSHNNTCLSLEGSRGCPYSCTFCDHGVSGNSYRTKSPKFIAEELSLIKRLGFNKAFFVDDEFALVKEHTIRLCRIIIEKNLQMSWDAIGVRLDHIDKETLSLMKKAGCHLIGVGIESGSERILKIINKQESIKQIITSINAIRHSGIKTTGYFMIGFPGETKEDIKRTINFACSLGLTYVETSFFTPLPNTPAFAKCSKKGRLLAQNFEDFSSLHKITFIPEGLSERELKAFYKTFYLRFYLRPRQIFYLIKSSITEKTLLDDIISFFKILIGGKNE
ncbi:MAG: radical SAM protein [Candidatus Woesearchaeota archaeon]|nr:radical SAM protein [Candidatus Woesearchaeota archaeon]